MNSSSSSRGGLREQCLALLFGALALFTPIASLAGPASPQKIVTYLLENENSAVERDVPVTFGAVFARGDVPTGSSLSATDKDGANIPLQVDAKAHHADGSLRHAVLTLSISHLEQGRQTAITISPGAKTNAPAISLESLPQAFDVVLDLSLNGKHLFASAHDLIMYGKPEFWLNGPLATEWWFAGPLRDVHGVADPQLSAQFGIRSYGKDRPLRIEVDVENDRAWTPGPRTEFYDAQIRANGKTVFDKTAMVQPSHTRWRQVFWWDKSADVFVKQDLNYLKKTRTIPNYDKNIEVSQAALATAYDRSTKSDRAPMSSGVLMKYMPTTGGRPDIGPLPLWTALYLLTMDRRAYEMMTVNGDLGGSFSAHYRNEKTGRPVTTEEFPKISTHSNYVGEKGELPLPDKGGYKDPLVPDPSHEPSLDFIPYLVTGDRYYLEELQFWSQWNSWGTVAENHGLGQSLVTWDQVRAQAWSLRTLAQAEYITPDADPMKQTLTRELKANLAWYDANFTNNPAANALHILFQAQKPSAYSGGTGIAPWQDDFFTWSVGYVQALGDVNALPLLRWKAVFPVQRMIAPDFCWILASAYEMKARNADRTNFYSSFGDLYRATLAMRIKNGADPASLKCGSDDMAEALGLKHAGEMVNIADVPDGYPAYLQPALAAAVDADIPGAKEAWAKFEARTVKPNYNTMPVWAIVPWADQ
jgi:PcRGLX-like N-terminal RIFT barrel domain